MTATKEYNPLIILLIITNGITVGVNAYIDAMGSGGYISALIWLIVSIAVYSLLFRQRAIVTFCRDDSIFKKVVLIIVVVVAIFNLTAMSAYFADYFSKMFYHSSPIWYILAFLTVPGAVGCAFGLKAVSRYAVVGVGAIILLTVAILAMSLSGYSTDNLYPLSGYGLKGVLASIKGAASFGAVMYYYILLCTEPKLAKAKSQKPAIVVALSGVFIFAVSLSCNLLLPYKSASLVDKPLYTIASSVSVNYLIERSEVLVLIIWLISVFVCIGGLGAVASHISSVAFDLGTASPLAACIYASAFAVSLLFNKLSITDDIFRYSIYITGVMSVILPLSVNLRYYITRR